MHDDVTERRKAKTDEIAALREEDKVLADKLDALVGSAGGSQVCLHCVLTRNPAQTFCYRAILLKPNTLLVVRALLTGVEP